MGLDRSPQHRGDVSSLSLQPKRWITPQLMPAWGSMFWNRATPRLPPKGKASFQALARSSNPGSGGKRKAATNLRRLRKVEWWGWAGVLSSARETRRVAADRGSKTRTKMCLCRCQPIASVPRNTLPWGRSFRQIHSFLAKKPPRAAVGREGSLHRHHSSVKCRSERAALPPSSSSVQKHCNLKPLFPPADPF